MNKKQMNGDFLMKMLVIKNFILPDKYESKF